jgi:hypothetical protein
VTRGRLVRIFWLGAAALLVVAALIAIVALLRGELTDTDAHILLTLGALFVTGAGALAGLALVDSNRFTNVGWVAAAAAPVEFTILTYWIWSGSEGDDTITKIGMTTLLAVAGQLAITTQLLLLSSRRLVALVFLTELLVAVAVCGTIAALWTEPDSSWFPKLLAAMWILAALCWFLLPVLQRYTAAGADTSDRVLGELDEIELVATHAHEGIDVRLARGERLLLRRRA